MLQLLKPAGRAFDPLLHRGQEDRSGLRALDLSGSIQNCFTKTKVRFSRYSAFFLALFTTS